MENPAQAIETGEAIVSEPVIHISTEITEGAPTKADPQPFRATTRVSIRATPAQLIDPARKAEWEDAINTVGSLLERFQNQAAVAARASIDARRGVTSISSAGQAAYQSDDPPF